MAAVKRDPAEKNVMVNTLAITRNKHDINFQNNEEIAPPLSK